MQWVNPANGRWYRADAATDLFGTPGIDTAWGGCLRPRTGQRFVPLASSMDADAAMRAIDTRRRRHGYLRAVPDPDPAASAGAPPPADHEATPAGVG